MTTTSLYAVTVTLDGYHPDYDPDETEAQWKADPHRRLIIAAPLDSHDGHSQQAVRVSRHYCAGLLARVALSLVDSIAYALTREDYEHRCLNEPWERWNTCGHFYEEGVVRTWDDGTLSVEFTVPTRYRTFWLDHAKNLVTDLVTADAKPMGTANPPTTHTATGPTERTSEKKAGHQ